MSDRLNAVIAERIEPITGPMPEHIRTAYAGMHEAHIIEHQSNGMSFEEAEQKSFDDITQAVIALFGP